MFFKTFTSSFFITFGFILLAIGLLNAFGIYSDPSSYGTAIPMTIGIIVIGLVNILIGIFNKISFLKEQMYKKIGFTKNDVDEDKAYFNHNDKDNYHF